MGSGNSGIKSASCRDKTSSKQTLYCSSLPDVCVAPGTSMREAIARIDKNGRGIVVVVDTDRKLLETITDGDVRRALLIGLDLNTAVKELDNFPVRKESTQPIVALAGSSPEDLLLLMRRESVRQLPLLDKSRRLVDLVTLRDLMPEDALQVQAVVMAGGEGKRLMPLTAKTPKPMLTLGEQPLLHRLVEQLRDAGIHRVHLTTHYRGEQIEAHFGDGSDFGVNLTYVQEDQPLGTAGALGLLEEANEPLLVVNGDILTNMNFRDMLNFHRDHDADMTVGVRMYELRVPYGVMHTEGVSITGMSEKPLVRQVINGGVYLLNPSILRYIPNAQRFDMPDLIKRLIAEKHNVVCFPIREYWLDIGRAEDYQQAMLDVEKLADKA